MGHRGSTVGGRGAPASVSRGPPMVSRRPHQKAGGALAFAARARTQKPGIASPQSRWAARPCARRLTGHPQTMDAVIDDAVTRLFDPAPSAGATARARAGADVRGVLRSAPLAAAGVRRAVVAALADAPLAAVAEAIPPLLDVLDDAPSAAPAVVAAVMGRAAEAGGAGDAAGAAICGGVAARLAAAGAGGPRPAAAAALHHGVTAALRAVGAAGGAVVPPAWVRLAFAIGASADGPALAAAAVPSPPAPPPPAGRVALLLAACWLFTPDDEALFDVAEAVRGRAGGNPCASAAGEALAGLAAAVAVAGGGDADPALPPSFARRIIDAAAVAPAVALMMAAAARHARALACPVGGSPDTAASAVSILRARDGAALASLAAVVAAAAGLDAPVGPPVSAKRRGGGGDGDTGPAAKRAARAPPPPPRHGGLPPDALRTVFSFCPLPATVSAAGAVCRGWHEAAGDAAVWAAHFARRWRVHAVPPRPPPGTPLPDGDIAILATATPLAPGHLRCLCARRAGGVPGTAAGGGPGPPPRHDFRALYGARVCAERAAARDARMALAAAQQTLTRRPGGAGAALAAGASPHAGTGAGIRLHRMPAWGVRACDVCTCSALLTSAKASSDHLRLHHGLPRR
jgi:hypothetical protein